MTTNDSQPRNESRGVSDPDHISQYYGLIDLYCDVSRDRERLEEDVSVFSTYHRNTGLDQQVLSLVQSIELAIGKCIVLQNNIEMVIRNAGLPLSVLQPATTRVVVQSYCTPDNSSDEPGGI